MAGDRFIKVEFDAKRMSKLLARAERSARNMRPCLQEIGEIVHASVMRNFEAQGRPRKWKKLKYTRKRGSRSGAKILQDSGRMKGSIRPRVIGNSGVEVGTNLGGSNSYGATHQFGRGSIPARPYLAIQNEDWPEIEDAVQDHILGNLRR